MSHVLSASPRPAAESVRSLFLYNKSSGQGHVSQCQPVRGAWFAAISYLAPPPRVMVLSTALRKTLHSSVVYSAEDTFQQ